MYNSAINFLYRTVAITPECIAVSDEHEALSFRELFTRACALSEHLADVNVLNRPILVYLPKNANAIVSFAAILLSGNCYVPADVGSPSERTRKIIADLGPAKVITQKIYKNRIQELIKEPEKIIFLDDICWDRQGTSIQQLIDKCVATTNRIIDVDPCYIMYTSGSTGAPKGVVISHRGVIDYIQWAQKIFPLTENDIIGNQSPLFFDNSTLDIYLSWATGATLHLIPERLFIFPIRLMEHLEQKKVTFIFFVPSVLASFTRKGVLTEGRLPDLKIIAFAGEVMSTKHLGTWQTKLPNKMYVNLYGPTEITVDCTYFIVDRIYGPDETLPIGYPCLNSEILILDENDKPVSFGEKGELCVRGSSLALGYWNEQEKAGNVFMQNPIHNYYEDRIYKTGDIVIQHKNKPIQFVGRKDSQIKHLGYRIELGEIEQATNSLPYISCCCVIYNQNKREITLYYESEKEVPASEIINDLSRIIPSYMMPKKFHHYKMLPLNPSGKVDRKALAEGIGC